MVIDLENYIGEESSFGSRYEIQPINNSQLPEGVVEALDTETGATVHIKCLEDLSNYDSLDDFINQAKNVSTLNHPNLLRVLDYGTNSRVNGLIVFEQSYCKNLRTILKESGSFKIEDAINIITQLISCLEFIHTRDYLHGSLSLLDIHIDQSVENKPVAKISGLLDTYPNSGDDYDTEDPFTQTFFSPEQITTDDYDSRADIFALGCLIYSIITGKNIDLRAAYNASSHDEILSVIEDEAIPIPLENIIVKCLDSDLENRFQTCTELLGAMGAVQRFIPSTSKKRRESLESPRTPKKPDPKGINPLLDKNESIDDMVSDQIDSITLFGSGSSTDVDSSNKSDESDSEVDFSDLDFPFEDSETEEAETASTVSDKIESKEIISDPVVEADTETISDLSSNEEEKEVDMEMDFSDLDFPMDINEEKETENSIEASQQQTEEKPADTDIVEIKDEAGDLSITEPEDMALDFSDLEFPEEIEAEAGSQEENVETPVAFDDFDGFSTETTDPPGEEISATINDAISELDVSQTFTSDADFQKDVTENDSFDIENSSHLDDNAISPEVAPEETSSPSSEIPLSQASDSEFDLEIISLSEFENDFENIESRKEEVSPPEVSPEQADEVDGEETVSESPLEESHDFFDEPASVEQAVETDSEEIVEDNISASEEESKSEQTLSQNEFFPEIDSTTDSSPVQIVSDEAPEQLVENLTESEALPDSKEVTSEEESPTEDRLDQLISTVNNTIPITIEKEPDSQTKENFEIKNDTIMDIIEESKLTSNMTPLEGPSDLIAEAAVEIGEQPSQEIPESIKEKGNFIESSLDDIRDSLAAPEIADDTADLEQEKAPPEDKKDNKIETFDSKDFSDFKSLDFDDMASSTSDSLGMKRLAEQLKDPKSKDNSLKRTSYSESSRFQDLENLLEESSKRNRKKNPFERHKEQSKSDDTTDNKPEDLNFGPIEDSQNLPKIVTEPELNQEKSPTETPKKYKTQSTLDEEDERMVTLSGSYFTLPTLSTLIEKQNSEEGLQTNEAGIPLDSVDGEDSTQVEEPQETQIESAVEAEVKIEETENNTSVEVEPTFAPIDEEPIEEESVDDTEVTRTLLDTDPIILNSPDNALLTSDVDQEPLTNEDSVFDPIEPTIEMAIEPVASEEIVEAKSEETQEAEEEVVEDGEFTETLLEAKPIEINQPDYSPLTEEPPSSPPEDSGVSDAGVDELHELVSSYRDPGKDSETEVVNEDEVASATTNSIELSVPEEIDEISDSIGIVKKEVPATAIPPAQEESVLQKAKRKVANTLIGAAAIKNNYENVSKIGESDLYSIYKVKESTTEKIAVAKSLETTEPAVTMEFVRKANQHATLLHSNIIRSVGSLDTSLGRPYFIMDHLDAITLESLLDSIGKIESPKEFYDIFSQVINAVEYSHNKNIMHGSLRPSNILLMEIEGQVVVKVLDFDMWSVRQMYHVVTGTPSPANRALYMSPEQFTQSDPTPQSDVYQLGILCIKMLTGKEPVQGGSYKEIMSKMLNENRKAIDLGEFRPDIETIEELDKVIKVATYFEENNRFQNVTDLKNALNTWWRNYQFAHHAEKQAKNTNLRALLQNHSVLRETELHQTETAIMKFTTFANTGPRQSPIKTLINYFIGLGMVIGLVCFAIINFDTLVENWNAISLKVGSVIHKEEPQEIEEPEVTEEPDSKPKAGKTGSAGKTNAAKASKSKNKRTRGNLKSIRSKQIKTERNLTTVPYEDKLYAPADKEISIPKNKNQKVYPYLYTEKQFKKWKEIRHFKDRPERVKIHDSKIEKVKSK